MPYTTVQHNGMFLMTQGHRDALDGWIGRVKDVTAVLASITIILCAIYWIIPGGLKFGSQVATDSITEKVNTIQSDVLVIKTIIATLPVVTAQITGQDLHLSRLDQALLALTDRLTADEMRDHEDHALLQTMMNNSRR